STFSNFYLTGKATNNGPHVATNLKVTSTLTPGGVLCIGCPIDPPQLAPGATASIFTSGEFLGKQLDFTRTIAAQERDPHPETNSVAWTRRGGDIVMDALYLTPGSQANIWYFPGGGTTITAQSSNPAVVSVPASVPAAGTNKPTTFAVQGLSAGTST